MAAPNTCTHRQKRKSPQFAPLQCGMCDNVVQRTGAKQRWCLACAGKLRSEREKQRNTGWQVFKCARCNVAVQRAGGGHQYCGDCSIAARKERDRAAQAGARNTPSSREKERERSARRNATESVKQYRREYEHRRRRSDPKFAVHARMKAMVANCLRGKKSGRSWVDLVGYSTGDLIKHLERQFLPGMSWENRTDWDVDHILPVSSFEFSDVCDDGFRAAWALTNLRPLWKTQNRQKGSKRTLLV